MKKSDVKAPKISNTKLASFQSALDEFVAAGYDVQLFNGQTEIWFYLDGAHGFNLVLGIDGRWRLE